MIDYTKQKDLGRFGDRWACYATCLINIIETEMNRGLTLDETYRTIGMWFVHEQILLANYKDHEKWSKEADGWKADVDPEWHFLIVNQKLALRQTLDLFNIPNMKHFYEILKLSTQWGDHFVLRIDHGTVVNPDPDIQGVISQTRKVE